MYTLRVLKCVCTEKVRKKGTFCKLLQGGVHVCAVGAVK